MIKFQLLATAATHTLTAIAPPNIMTHRFGNTFSDISHRRNLRNNRFSGIFRGEAPIQQYGRLWSPNAYLPVSFIPANKPLKFFT